MEVLEATAAVLEEENKTKGIIATYGKDTSSKGEA
jgi:hypothetical protein